MILDHVRGAAKKATREVANVVTLASTGLAGSIPTGDTAAMKLAAVNRCIEVISDSVGKMNSYAMQADTRERLFPPVLDLLNGRPNEAMTPFIRRKMLEINRLTRGNAYDWIVRNPITMEPVELIPLPAELVYPWQDTTGKIWYDVSHPYTGRAMRLPNEDVLHYKGYSRDGLHCLSVLQRAAQVIEAGLNAQGYQSSYYANGGQPLGVLSTDADLGGYVKGKDNKPTETTKKDALRREWEKTHSGPDNGFRVAILDHGLKYTPINATMKDAEWVSNHDVTVLDICNFFGVPAYKLNAGKQSYSSNEQNAIEYVTGTLHPIITQYEQEQTWKLLMPSQRRQGLELHINMMAELRGDHASRANWYAQMRNVGAYSVNEIRQHEDLPDVPGGDVRLADLNHIPLELFEELSVQRNTGGGGKTT